jgi:tRNA(fMet)-specific endonuclease VapC
VKYLLDSNIIIAAALASGEPLRQRLALGDADDFATSAIVYAEVVHGTIRGKPPAFVALQSLIEEIPVLPFDDLAARAYAGLPFKRASYDRLIAAHALALGLVLVTDNVSHYADVPGLKVENWTMP